MRGGEEPLRLGRLRAGVLDRLGLVENRVIELDVLEDEDVAAQRAVGRQDDGVGAEEPGAAPPRAPRAGRARVIEDLQSRREAGRLLLPVEDERLRSHDETRTALPRRANIRSGDR